MSGLYTIITVIVISGGFGGFIFGLISRSEYNICLPGSGKKIKLGFLGDILIGITASITIYFVAGSLFGMEVKSNLKPDLLVRMMALGVLSGFAGIRLLSGMTSALMKRIQDIDERIEQCEVTDRVTELIRQADFMLNHNPANAKIIYEKALLIDPGSDPAKIGLAKALRRLDKMEEGIAVLTEVIEKNPNSERAYYNRSCFKHLSNEYSKEDALSDLQKAIELFNPYRFYAIEDKDFMDIKNDSGFRAILQE